MPVGWAARRLVGSSAVRRRPGRVGCRADGRWLRAAADHPKARAGGASGGCRARAHRSMCESGPIRRGNRDVRQVGVGAGCFCSRRPLARGKRLKYAIAPRPVIRASAASGRLVISVSPRHTAPDAAASSPAMMRVSVDLPDRLGLTIAVNSPARMPIQTSSSAGSVLRAKP